MYFRSDGLMVGMLVKGQQFSPSSRHLSAVSLQQGQTSGRSMMGRFALVSNVFLATRGFDSSVYRDAKMLPPTRLCFSRACDRRCGLNAPKGVHSPCSGYETGA